MRITALRVLGACLCIGAALMLLSTFKMDKFLRSALPGKIHLSARRSGELLPFAGTDFLSGNQQNHRRLIQPFKGHTFVPAKPKPDSEATGIAGEGVTDSKAATEPHQQVQMPDARDEPEEPAKESSTGGVRMEELEDISGAELLAEGLHETGSAHPKLTRAALKHRQRLRAERRVTLRQAKTPPSYLSGDAGWDYDVEAQALQARLLDLNSIMPGALRKLDSSRMAAAEASGRNTDDSVPASPQCRALISGAIEDNADRERREKEEYFANLPNLWDPKQAAAVLEAEKPKEVISRADKTKADFPPGSEGMLGRSYTEGLKRQERIVNISHAFVDSIKAAGLSEEEVESLWLRVLSPVAAELFRGQMEDFRARRAEVRQRAAQPMSEEHRIAVGMLGALCGNNKECIAEFWRVCEQRPECVHDIWHLRREQGQLSELQISTGLSIAAELGRRQAAEGSQQEPEQAGSVEQPEQTNSTNSGSGAMVAHFGSEAAVGSQLSLKDLKKQVGIAYETAAATAESTSGGDSAPREAAPEESPNERPWEKLDSIFARLAREREAAFAAAAEAEKAAAMDMSLAQHSVTQDSESSPGNDISP